MKCIKSSSEREVHSNKYLSKQKSQKKPNLTSETTRKLGNNKDQRRYKWRDKKDKRPLQQEVGLSKGKIHKTLAGLTRTEKKEETHTCYHRYTKDKSLL